MGVKKPAVLFIVGTQTSNTLQKNKIKSTVGQEEFQLPPKYVVTKRMFPGFVHSVFHCPCHHRMKEFCLLLPEMLKLPLSLNPESVIHWCLQEKPRPLMCPARCWWRMCRHGWCQSHKTWVLGMTTGGLGSAKNTPWLRWSWLISHS